MRGSVSVSLGVPESDYHTENLQFLKVLKKQKKSIVLYLPRGGPEWLHRLYFEVLNLEDRAWYLYVATKFSTSSLAHSLMALDSARAHAQSR